MFLVSRMSLKRIRGSRLSWVLFTQENFAGKPFQFKWQTGEMLVKYKGKVVMMIIRLHTRLNLMPSNVNVLLTLKAY